MRHGGRHGVGREFAERDAGGARKAEVEPIVASGAEDVAKHDCLEAIRSSRIRLLVEVTRRRCRRGAEPNDARHVEGAGCRQRSCPPPKAISRIMTVSHAERTRLTFGVETESAVGMRAPVYTRRQRG